MYLHTRWPRRFCGKSLPFARASQNKLLVVILLALTFSACSSSRDHVRLRFVRYSDTLQVALDPNSSANWSATKDSVVVDCSECSNGKDHAAYSFQDGRAALLDLSGSTKLKLKVYRGSKIDTSYQLDARDLSDSRTLTGAKHETNANASQPRSTTDTTTDSSTNDGSSDGSSGQTRRYAHRATSIRVIAKEGVAVYKDKTKREVLKILAQGSLLPYLAREGEVFSVMIDDVEGFVDADAVEVLK